MTRGADRRFQLRRCLGSGGFGEVYEATMTSSGGLDTLVAIKVLRTDLELPEEALRRLRDEARTLARLDHPSIVRAIDVLQLEGRWALITELVDGEDLDACIEGTARLSHRALLQVIGQVADALDAASTAEGPDGPLGLVHRDVKPSNIRVGRHGQVKLLDFGIAWFAGSDREAQTASDMMLGSLPYMAPERFVDRRQMAASDVFSLGCCLYEGLSSTRFYESSTLRTLSALALDKGDFRALHQRRIGSVDASPALRELLERLLDYDAARRPTAREVARACEALADEAPGPSLRLWCADRRWQDPGTIRGSLDGRTLTEGPLPNEPLTKAPSDAARPRIVPQAWGTIDPSMEVPAGGPVKDATPPKRFDTPSAPPAFPSIPLGMAIKENLVSESDVQTVLREEDAPPAAARKKAVRVDVPKSPEAQRLSAPLPTEAPASSSPLKWVAIAGCLGLLAVGGVGTVITLAGGFFMFM